MCFRQSQTKTWSWLSLIQHDQRVGLEKISGSYVTILKADVRKNFYMLSFFPLTLVFIFYLEVHIQPFSSLGQTEANRPPWRQTPLQQQLASMNCIPWIPSAECRTSVIPKSLIGSRDDFLSRKAGATGQKTGNTHTILSLPHGSFIWHKAPDALVEQSQATVQEEVMGTQANCLWIRTDLFLLTSIAKGEM